MKTLSLRAHVNAALCTLLAGCSGVTSTPAPTERAAATAPNPPGKYAGLRDLYVADDGAGAILLFKNHHYTPDGTITNGINGPWDVALDQAGNLYVANRSGSNVTEYAPGASQPSFVYSDGMSYLSPLGVSVDRQGHVYETDSPALGGPQTVNEYDQHDNSRLYSCSVSGPGGMAIDREGDVFVGTNSRNQGGHILEFKGGLSGCSPTTLGVRLDSAGGMAIDNRDNLIVSDGLMDRVYEIAPPYSSLGRKLGGVIYGPSWVSIDRANKTVFVAASYMRYYVWVIDYATGKKITRLGSGHRGLSLPLAAVDGPNAVQ